MKDRYRVAPPSGGEKFDLQLETGASVAEAYADVAEHLGCAIDAFALLLRNPPGAALPFLHLAPADDVPLWRAAPPGSVLVVELAASEPAAMEAVAASAGSTAAAPSVAAPVAAQRRADVQPPERQGLSGLRNLGNTCYLNSALQCLSQTPLLCGQLRRRVPAAAVAPGAAACGGADAGEGALSSSAPAPLDGARARDAERRVLAACRGVLEALWSATASEAPAPRELKAAVAARAGIFDGSGQQDAQEFLQALLELLHEDLRRPGDAERPAEPPPEAEQQRAATLWNRASSEDASVVSDVFQGQLRSAVRCSRCGRQEASFELFWSLPLPLRTAGAESQRLLKLEDTLDAFCAEESLDGAWRCEGCGQTGAGSKRLSLWRLPPVLQLHLKRFHWKQTATRTAVPIAELPGSGADTAAPPVPPGGLLGGAPVPMEASDDEGAGGEPAAVQISVDDAPQGIAAALPWEKQDAMYNLVGRLLLNIVKAPDEAKFRSVGKANAKIRGDLLDQPGGDALLRWCGFRDDEAGGRYDAAHLAAEALEAKYAELQRHADRVREAHQRRLRDERIEHERRRRLPTGDAAPIRRWGGRLPSFGRGAGAGYSGLQCEKVDVRVLLAPDPSRSRGFALLQADRWLGGGAPACDERGGYELFAVVQHLGSTPFSGHYVAACWHEPSASWWRFDDSTVTRISPERISDDVLTSGSYVLFLERVADEGFVMVHV